MADTVSGPPNLSGVDISMLQGVELMILIAHRYQLETAESGAAVWDEPTDRARALEAIRLRLVTKARKELTDALIHLGSFIEHPRPGRRDGEEIEAMTEAFTRFWEAKRAYEAVAGLVTQHLMRS